MTWLWGILAAIALLWPGRLSGPLDGMPLDRMAEAVLIGIVFPALWWFNSAFLNRRTARVLIVSLLAWKAFTSAALVQDGWCVSLIPSRPYVTDQTGLPHSWDVRADWRAPNPACAAVMTRPYAQMDDFPVWFFNLTSVNGELPSPEDIPPAAVTRMTINGTLTARSPGVLRIATVPSITATMRVDGQPVPVDGSDVASGSHQISIDTTITKNLWRFAVLWNGDDVFAHVIAAESSPSAFDRVVRPWGRWITPLVAGTLLIVWLLTSLSGILDWWALAWMLTASLATGLMAAFTHQRHWQWAALGLTLSALLPLATRVRNVRGAFLLVGVPWLVLVVVATKYDIGRMLYYGAGNDSWTFQRYAYRIFLQGYWLEGGEKTFWFQPFYRWTAGALHLVFGDSSVGEQYWNGMCLAIMALFSFRVTKVFAGVRWGLVAAAFTLALFVAGPGFVFIQNGLSEVSSAGFIYLGALCAMRSRHGSYGMALAAGACAILGFYTRLNNVIMASAVVLFAWPLAQPISILVRPASWFRRVSIRTIVVVSLAIGVGLLLFALRTYHYTGRFSIFYGTQRDITSNWQASLPVVTSLQRMASSVMMVLATTDPPVVHNGALPLIAAALMSIAAVAGLPLFRTLPLPAVLFMLATLAGALVARGAAYPGRFSIHTLGAASTVFVCTVAAITRKVSERLE